MKFEYEIDEKLLNEKEQEHVQIIGKKKVFENVLLNCLSQVYPEGISGSTVKALERILEKLDASNDKYIEIESSEFDILEEAFDNKDIKISPTQVRIYSFYKKKLKECDK